MFGSKFTPNRNAIAPRLEMTIRVPAAAIENTFDVRFARARYSVTALPWSAGGQIEHP